MIYQINSRANKKLKQLLQEKDNYFFFEGEKLVKDIIQNKIKIEKLIVNSAKRNTLVINTRRIPEIWYVNKSILSKISHLKETADIIAIVNLKNKKINFRNSEVILVLDNIQDPANAGTIFRCAAAFGIKNIALTGEGVHLNNPKFIRSAQNAIFNINFQRFESLEILLTRSANENLHIYLTSAKFTKKMTEIAEIKFPCLIILGNEGQGLNPELFKHYESIRISQNNSVDSLNVGICGCLLMYELMKILKK